MFVFIWNKLNYIKILSVETLLPAPVYSPCEGLYVTIVFLADRRELNQCSKKMPIIVTYIFASVLPICRHSPGKVSQVQNGTCNKKVTEVF